MHVSERIMRVRSPTRYQKARDGGDGKTNAGAENPSVFRRQHPHRQIEVAVVAIQELRRAV
jgi:hypothetical protein